MSDPNYDANYDWSADIHMYKLYVNDTIDGEITAELDRKGITLDELRKQPIDRRVGTVSGVVLKLGYYGDLNGVPRTMRRNGQARKWLELRGLATA